MMAKIEAHKNYDRTAANSDVVEQLLKIIKGVAFNVEIQKICTRASMR
jgi:hypothetical protein